MGAEPSPLGMLSMLMDRLPLPACATTGRGRPTVCSERLMLKAVVVMIGKRLPTVHLFVTVLDQPTAGMRALRAVWSKHGRVPCRRTWARRLAVLPDRLPAQIGLLGPYLVALIEPWRAGGAVAAIDSTVLHAHGGVWHKKHRDADIVPQTSIDTETHWTKSGWHGWGYGWKLHLVVSVAAVRIPLAAELTAANVADNQEALELLTGLRATIHDLLGDTA